MDKQPDLLDQLQQLTAELRGQFSLRLGSELSGLTAMHGRVLLLIARVSEVTAQQLSDMLRRDKAQITRLLNDLQQAGLMLRKADPLDGRRQLLLLSEQGQQLAARLTVKKRQIASTMLIGLTDQQQNQMTQLLAQMYSNLVSTKLSAD